VTSPANPLHSPPLSPAEHKALAALLERLRRNVRTREAATDCLHQLHDDVFARTDCTQCAACCTVGTPIFGPRDVDRLARHLRLRPAEFETRYLRRDPDGDLVLQSSPCPFLGADKRCTVYEHRPTNCREYPQTRKANPFGMTQHLLRTTDVCPAARAIYRLLLAENP